jgi:AcrR family transcriptional regulator
MATTPRKRGGGSARSAGGGSARSAGGGSARSAGGGSARSAGGGSARSAGATRSADVARSTRPTAATRPASAARQRVLDTAFRLFYARGVRGVGVDTVIAESGVAKATLYKHFPRKDDLVLAYLDMVDGAWFGALRSAARDAGDEPGDQLVGMFDALATACRRDGYHGCAFINTAAEAAAGTDVHARTVEHKNVVRAWITDLAQRAGARDPGLLGRQLALLLDGGLAAGVLDADPAAAEAAKRAARALVTAACR